MKSLIPWAFSLFLFVNSALAQVGVSYFALNGFTKVQCNTALKVFNGVEIPAVAILWGSFDKDPSFYCLKKFLRDSSNRPHILYIHFSNEAGRRNKRLAPYEFLPRLSSADYSRKLARLDGLTFDKIYQRLSKIYETVIPLTNANTQIIVTTGLEDNFSDKAAKNITSFFRQVLPWEIPIVRNHEGAKDNFNKHFADAIELHGEAATFRKSSFGRCTANLDGDSIDFDGSLQRRGAKSFIPISRVPDFIRKNRDSRCLIFLWWSGPQSGDRGIFVEPRRRSFRIRSQDVGVINSILKKVR